MPMSNSLKTQIADSMSLLKKLQTIIADNYEASLPVAVKEIVDALPFIIAEAKLTGLNYAVAMTLREGIDFAEPSRMERFRNKKPRVEILRLRAKAVFQYCLENGLQPEFTPYEKGDNGKYTSQISITWEPHLLESLPTKSVVDGTFLKGLRDTYANSTTPKGLVARGRLSGALEKLPEMLRIIELAAVHRQPSALAHAQYVPMHEGKQIPDLTADLKAFCELLGLKADVEIHQGSISSRGNVYGFDLKVSGWA